MTSIDDLLAVRKQYADGTVVLGELLVVLDRYLELTPEPTTEEDEVPE